jgi:23S rRNA (cytidine1920-2'-O)/16S rRNA (cytidine1409-2'-O)-methyltransferase
MDSPVGQKKRLDIWMVERGLTRSRESARRCIIAGQVRVNGQLVVHPSTPVAADANVHLQARLPYVGRGGLKLAAALTRFAVDVTGLVVADIGASTGGFTDCLLQHGAQKVYAIDVGYGQLDWSLRQHARVVVMERVNARYLTADTLPERIDLVTIDVSFIALRLILPGALHVLKPAGHIVALLKPQFEACRSQVGRGGIVRDSTVHRDVLQHITTWAITHGLAVHNAMPSPIRGADGNVEFLLHLGTHAEPEQDVEALIERCMAEMP